MTPHNHGPVRRWMAATVTSGLERGRRGSCSAMFGPQQTRARTPLGRVDTPAVSLGTAESEQPRAGSWQPAAGPTISSAHYASGGRSRSWPSYERAVSGMSAQPIKSFEVDIRARSRRQISAALRSPAARRMLRVSTGGSTEVASLTTRAVPRAAELLSARSGSGRHAELVAFGISHHHVVTLECRQDPPTAMPAGLRIVRIVTW
jgi:hypothetical protein